MAWSQEQKDDFDLKVFKVLCNMLPEDFNDNVPIDEAQGKQKLLIAEWLSDGAKDKAFPEVSDALVEFQRYVSKNHIKYGQAVEEYFEMTATFDYGAEGGVISWKLGSQFEVRSPNDRFNAQANLWQALGQLRDDFERKTMLRLKNTNVQPSQQSNSFDEINCSRLIVDVKDGKVAYKIKGGKFEKWGVRVFPDILKANGIDPDAIPLAGLDMSGWCMTIIMRGNNPDKVTKLVKVG